MEEINSSPIIFPSIAPTDGISTLGRQLAHMSKPDIARVVTSRGRGEYGRCDFQDVSFIADGVEELREAITDVMRGSGFELTEGVGDSFTIHEVVAGKSFSLERGRWHDHASPILVMRWDDLVETAIAEGRLLLPESWRENVHSFVETALRTSTTAQLKIVPPMTPVIFGPYDFHKANLPLGSGGRPIVQFLVRAVG